MQFITVTEGAASALVSERTLQSTEFENGLSLASMLKNPSQFEGSIPNIHVTTSTSGVFLLRDAETPNLLVVDLAQAAPFEDFSESDALLIFQRFLRTAVKIWRNLPLAASERSIRNSNKTVLFPFPIRSQRDFRLVLERGPDKRRTDKRHKGDHLLLFKASYDEGEGATEKPTLGTFRKAIAEYPADLESGAHASLPSGQLGQTTPPPLSHTTLEVQPQAELQGLGFDNWLPLLTTKQLNFVETPVGPAEGLEGPAGTGKTLCLILRCINQLRLSKGSNNDHHSLFIAHGEATQQTIKYKFELNDPDRFWEMERHSSQQSLEITTLQAWCGAQLASSISEAEFLDKDAMEAKEQRLLHVAMSLSEAKSNDLATHRAFLSETFLEFLTTEDEFQVAEMLQHEISVMIKGRAGERLETYRDLPILSANLPLEVEGDKDFVFTIFKRYQNQLSASAQFDTDDIVLTTMGQLDTPIWRRRRRQEGYDSIFIDETHLFNLNELSIFHHLTRNESEAPIIFSMDRSQATGERGLQNNILEEVLHPDGEIAKTSIQNVFRSSPQIVNLALSVTASGATLFDSFDNPLIGADSTFTYKEERLADTPGIYSYPNDEAMVSGAFSRAEALQNSLDCRKSDVAIVAFTPMVFDSLQKVGVELNKPIETLARRGDIQVVSRARKSGRFVLSLADYLGGLEFQAVVLVGVDEGRVPPASDSTSSESRHFLNYSSHNRMYVAITRARYRVDFLITTSRGLSPILQNALEKGFVEHKSQSPTN